jgi:outer membrane protein insertion porin family
MNINFQIGETARTYVERIEIKGNTATRDKVIRREFRINEGDAFNAIKLSRSQDRIQSLGFFQENLEIKQAEGSAPDRVVLSADVEERSTGEIALSAGYSSLERFIVSANIAQRNFMGKGQELNAGVNWSRYSKSVQLGFVEPYLFDRQILLGGEIYRRDYNSFNFTGDGERNRTYSQTSTGAGLRLGFPVTEFLTFGTRYSFVIDEITLDKDTFFTDPDLIDPDGSGPLPPTNGPEPPQCDPQRASQYLCDELGTRTTSSVGYSVVFDNTNAVRATRGHRLTLSQDFAGLGGEVRYIRTRGSGTKYWGFGGGGFILSAHAEGGYIHPLEDAPGPGRDAVRITDRFFGQQMRGFDIRGIGPRVVRTIFSYDAEGEVVDTEEGTTSSLGGRAYYMGRLELEVPTSAGIRSMGLRPSVYVDVGSVFNITKPRLIGLCTITDEDPATPTNVIIEADEECDPGYLLRFRERFLGDSIKPRLSVGVGVNWVSPFGPLRIDIAKALLKEEGDDTKFFSFNVGTRF